jgi:hypothetical protein
MAVTRRDEPFRQTHADMNRDPDSHDHDREREPIPGERESDTLVGTETGAVGGIGFGAGMPPVDSNVVMDRDTIREHEKEAGGARSQRER